jgi:hypothetical protein
VSDSQQVEVIVTAIDNPVSSTLQEFTNYEINSLRSEAPGFRLYNNFRAGLRAYVLIYGDNGFLLGSPERNLEIYTLDQQGTLYRVEYSASPELFSTYLPNAMHMIRSFNLIDTSSSSNNSNGGSFSQPLGGGGGSISSGGNEVGGSTCPTPGPGGCNGAFSQGPGPFSPLNPNFGQTPLQQNVPSFNPNSP